MLLSATGWSRAATKRFRPLALARPGRGSPVPGLVAPGVQATVKQSGYFPFYYHSFTEVSTATPPAACGHSRCGASASPQR